ncbi:MAG: hypothetical protein K9L17_12280 [Clostridiales bacterium]|nr:hypothetical protein [Clostridiales bacterium]MCF8023459.1 hypothetical protein [Clostridiales bacterium]
MKTVYEPKAWAERFLEKPFLQAEMVKTEILKAPPGEENMIQLVLLGGFSVVYFAFCVYSAARFLL